MPESGPLPDRADHEDRQEPCTQHTLEGPWEFPLEDAPLSRRQLERCIRGMVMLMEEYYDVLRVAAEEGRFDQELVDNPELARVSDDLSAMLDLMPASVLEEALKRAREEGR